MTVVIYHSHRVPLVHLVSAALTHFLYQAAAAAARESRLVESYLQVRIYLATSEVNKYLVAKGLLARYICSCQLAGIRTAN